jgi:TusA-related sulfurtransferase
MPIIKAKKEYETLATGQVLKVVATDKSSIFDFQSLVKNLKGAQLLGQDTVSEGATELYVHYIKHGG